MKKQPTVNWDERYAQDEYVFGTNPNDFLTTVVDRIKQNGEVLSLCDGEGRNGVFLAQNNLSVLSLDASKVGLAKAESLAKERGVEIQTTVANLNDYEFEPATWDAIVLMFGHFPPDLRAKVLSSVPAALKNDGVFIMEAFETAQAGRDTGGPDDVQRLYDLEATKALLTGLEFEIADAKLREVSAGESHKGEAAVVQIVARKKTTSV